MPDPRVTVLMGVHNGEAWLAEAIDSILGQTFTDFEFLIVDDGSTDQTPSILDRYKDPRLIRLENETRLGLTRSLNIGLKATRGEYIARMDADDISLPHRLSTQTAWLDDHPETAMIGTQAQAIDGSGRPMYRLSYPTDSLLITWRLLYENTFAHPTVMFRTDVARRSGGYDEQFPYSQDFQLWTRLIQTENLGQLPDVLLKYRDHDQRRTIRNRDEQSRCALRIVRDNIMRLLGRDVPDHLIHSLWAVHGIWRVDGMAVSGDVFQLLEELMSAFSRARNLTRKQERRICRYVAHTMATYSQTHQPGMRRRMLHKAACMDWRHWPRYFRRA